MQVLGLVPARGGSKGVPRKNIRPLLGKPLLQYTAEVALDAERLDRVILSTDDEEIAEVGRACGLDVPFLRPASLATDAAVMVPVVEHALRHMEADDHRFDAVCLLQPTHPLRLPTDIDGAITLLEQTGADSVISFVEVGAHHPARMKFVDADDRVTDPPFAEKVEGQPRQQLPEIYLREGSVYVTRRDVVMEQHSLRGRDCRAWTIPPERACNIDTELDLLLAEFLLQRGA